MLVIIYLHKKTGRVSNYTFVSDIAVFVLKSDVKLQLTSNYTSQLRDMPARKNAVHFVPDADDQVLAVSRYVLIKQPWQARDEDVAVRQQINGRLGQQGIHQHDAPAWL